MGRKSTKDNKSIYQINRENADLTREEAAERTGFLSASKIEKIENNKVTIIPDDVLALAQCYKNLALCNYYCSNECSIGKLYVPEIEIKDIAQIALEMVNTLNRITKEKERFIEIIVDGEITADEKADFARIQETLDQLSLTIDSLKLWFNSVNDPGSL